jgi:fatty acid desaturase
MIVFGYTQHAGLAEDVLDHRLNSRTVYMNPIFRFLYWEMNYHVEHHMFPMVPFHALGKLHQELKPDMPKPYNGLWEAYSEIIPTTIRQVKEPTYYVRRELPSTAKPVPSLEPA